MCCLSWGLILLQDSKETNGKRRSSGLNWKKEIGGSTVTSDALLISVCVASCLLKMSIQLLLGNIALTLYYNNFSRNSALVIFLTIKIKKTVHFTSDCSWQAAVFISATKMKGHFSFFFPNEVVPLMIDCLIQNVNRLPKGARSFSIVVQK